VFAGRHQEIAALADAFRTPGSVVTLFGGAGMGKSRLLGQAASLVAGDVRVLTGRCLPLSVDMPLLCVVDVLRSFSEAEHGQLFESTLRRCPTFVRPELARLLPELGETTTSEPLRHRQFEACRRLLVEAQSVAVVIDDLHWCDAASLDFLEYVMARPAAPPLVLAVRPVAECSDRIRQWVSRILRLPDVRRIDLGPLSSDDVNSMLASRPWTGTAEDARRIVQRSGGVPYYVEQLASVDCGDGLPDTVQSLLQARLAGLDGRALDVLRVLAVAGRPVTDDEMHAACGVDAGDALRELRARGLVEDDSVLNGRRRRAPAHALLAEAIRGELTAEEVRVLHARFADALIAQTGVDPDDVARHLARAGDPGREAGWRVRAAEQARQRAAPREAFRHLARVIALDPDADIHTYLDAYMLARHAGDTRAGADLAERMLGRFEATADPDVRMRLWHAVGHHRVLREPGGLDALARAVEIGRSLPLTPEYGYVLYDYVRHLRGRGQVAQACALGPELAKLAAECSDADLRMLVDVELACHALLVDDVDTASHLIDRARGGSAHAIGPGLNAAGMITFLFLETGRLDELVTFAPHVITKREADGLSAASVTGSLRADLAVALLEQGRVDDAERALGAAVEGLPAPDAAASAEVRTVVDTARGHIADAEHYWDQTPPLLAYPALLTEAAPVRLRVLIEAGRPADAVHHGMNALRVVLTCDQSRFAAETISWVRRAMGDLAEASLEPTDIRRQSAELDDLIAAAPVDPLRPRVFPVTGAAAGRTDAAERSRVYGPPDPGLWATAADAWRSLGRPWRASYCEWRGAQATLSFRGRRADAITALRRAATDAIGYLPLTTAITDLAKVARIELAIATDAPEPSNSLFTQRENAVLRLMAEGLTNAEIGRALYISPKTAGVHVSNILRKLGVRSRVEAATKAHRTGLLI
jgi:DNA-binding CsgD family transcriptional regulator